MGYTLVNSGTVNTAGSSSTQTVNVTGVNAGDLVFAFASSHTSNSVNSISDGTTTLTLLGQHIANSGVYTARAGYLLASVATGTVTYTATYSAASTNRSLTVYVFTPTAAVTFDQDNWSADNSFGNPAVSGAITTTGSDELIFGAEFNDQAVHTSPLIGGAAATAQISATWISMYYKATTGTSITAQVTPGNSNYISGIASFKISGGASGRIFKLAGVGGGLVGPNIGLVG